MSSSFDRAVKDLVQIMTEPKKNKTSPYDTQAEVIRVEGDTAWVHIPGGVDETPVKLTMNAQAGDTVQVRISGGNAWLQGNATSPPTDDTRANEALNTADNAIQSAINARIAAESAKQSAATAEEYAAQAKETTDEINAYADSVHKTVTQVLKDGEEAGEAAEQAKTDAASAKTSAENASEYAARALGNLSTVQNVTEALNWITAHGTMTLTGDYVASSDTEVVEGKKYYSRTGSGTEADPYVYTLIANPTGDPSQSGYFEGALDPTHVYFVQDNNGDYTVGGTRYAIVIEPNVADIGTYYELSIDESLNNYVATHLALTDDGLYVMADGSQWKVLITDDGVYILDPNNLPANQMAGDGNIIGYEGETHAEIDYHSLQLIARNETVPFFWVSDLRDKNDDYQATITETFTADGETKTFRVQLPISAEVSATDSSHSSNTATRSGQDYTFATTPSEGATVTIVYKTKSVLVKAYTLGQRESGGVGAMSAAEGYNIIASGYISHAEGYYTIASGKYSHAEGGYHTTASGESSHAEGDRTTASGYASHAEGSDTIARGSHSHAQNDGTTAGYRDQTAIGKYNDNQSDNAFEIGNGTDDNNRSNAFTVDWDGNVEMALDITATSGSDKEIYDALVALGWDSDVIV